MQTINEVTDPVEAINFLNGCRECVLIMHNLHLFLDVPEVVQAIQNGVCQWKSTGCALITISPVIRLNPELEQFFTVIDHYQMPTNCMRSRRSWQNRSM